MSEHTPRPYQAEATSAVRAALAAGKRRVLIVAPTGAGKTTVAADIARRAVERGRSLLFVAHRRELIQQALERLEREHLRCGVIMRGHPQRDPRAQVQVASVQTLMARAKREPLPPFDLMFIDEAHRSMAATYQWLLAQCPAAIVLGLTATPTRLDGRGLGDCFDHMHVVAQVKDLVAQGYLVRPRLFAPYRPDLDAIKIRSGDYAAGEAEAVMDKSELVADIVSTWTAKARSLRTVLFAAGIAHSKHLCEAFCSAGVRAEHIDGGTDKVTRAAALHRLATGATELLCNVDILTEGWDLPGLECTILARPTKSVVLYLQMVGRGMRPADGKRDSIVLDHAGCIMEHGPPTMYREWELTTSRKRDAAAPISMKVCPQCFACIPSATRECPECGHAFSVRERDQLETRDGELVEVDQDGDALCPCGSAARTKSRNAEKWGRFAVLIRCAECGRPLGWEQDSPANATRTEKATEYDRLMRVAMTKGLRPGWAAHAYKRTFGAWPRGVAAWWHRHAIERERNGLEPWAGDGLPPQAALAAGGGDV